MTPRAALDVFAIASPRSVFVFIESPAALDGELNRAFPIQRRRARCDGGDGFLVYARCSADGVLVDTLGPERCSHRDVHRRIGAAFASAETACGRSRGRSRPRRSVRLSAY